MYDLAGRIDQAGIASNIQKVTMALSKRNVNLRKVLAICVRARGEERELGCIFDAIYDTCNLISTKRSKLRLCSITHLLLSHAVVCFAPFYFSSLSLPLLKSCVTGDSTLINNFIVNK